MTHWAKIGRAHEHLYTISQSIERFLEMKPYRLIGEYDPKPPFNHGATVHFTARLYSPATLPTQLPFLIGDCLEGKYLPVEIVAIMERLQPYQGCNGLKGDDLLRCLDKNDLWILDQLVNTDKHRTLVYAAGVRFDGMPVQIKGGHIDNVLTNFSASGSFEHGADVLSVPFTATASDAEVIVEPDFSVDVAFGEEGVADGRPVIKTLEKIADSIRDVFVELEPFL